MVNEREAIRQLVSKRAGGRPVRWTDERTSRGDFDGRAWALELFDVPVEEKPALYERLWEIKERVRAHLGQSLTLIFHTPAETERLYPWVREATRPLAIDSAIPSIPRLQLSRLTAASGWDTRRGGMLPPRAA